MPEDDADEDDTSKKKGKKGKKEKEKDKGKKKTPSLVEIPVIKKEKPIEKEPNIRIDGLKNLKLTTLTQKILGCIVGEHVTAESPWVSVEKELVDENLYLHHESSDFLPIKEDLANYTDATLLMGYDPDYIPYEGEDYHRFYIAVTEKARENLLSKLDEERRLAEERLKNSVNKKILPWQSLGSEVEVDFSTAKNTRPLIELQLETDIDELLRPVQFRDRNVGDAKDGYVKIGPGRHEFPGVFKRRVDMGVQAVPAATPHCAQTDPGIPSNAWTQYVYDMDTAQEAMKRGDTTEIQEDYVFAERDYMEKSLEYNETFDLYTNDYPLLVQNEKDDMIPCKSLFEEYQAFTDVKHCKKMLISSIAWHPMKTGVVALAYSLAARCLPASEGDMNVDQVSRDVYSKNPVLIWSFKDELKPRLILESPREVYTIAWCPTEPNILVGGCASGQIIIWDLKGKMEAVEGHEYLTPDQQRYRLAMETLVGWLKPQAPAKYVRPAALSNIQSSHSGRITQIQWLPPYYEWNEYGHLIDVPVSEGRTSMQIISSGEDGVIRVWDLNKLSPDSGPGKPKKRKARKRPSALTSQISPFKAGDRLFRPIYLLYPEIPAAKVRPKLTTLSMKTVPLQYEMDTSAVEAASEEERTNVQTEGTQNHLHKAKRDESVAGTQEEGAVVGKEEKVEDEEKEFFKEDIESGMSTAESLELTVEDGMTQRETYRPVMFPPDEERQKQLRVSTDEGQTMTLCWEGFDFHKGEEITTEAGQIVNMGCAVHDGPIVLCARSPFISDLVLTLGGKVFALWVEELGSTPLFWKTNSVSVTCGSWSPYCPCIFHIGRADGSMEVWDFLIRSNGPSLVQSLSGQILTSMQEHTLPLRGDHGILGVADYNNSFRLLFFPDEYKQSRKDELQILRNFIKNEVNLRLNYREWNEMFVKKNAEELNRLREKTEAEEKARREAEQAAEVEAQQRAKLEEEETKRLARSRNVMVSISERYLERLKEEREKQMQRVLMEKKRLDKKELMAKQQPILMMRQMEKEKRKKQRDKIRQQQKIFDKTVTMLFPEIVEKPSEGPTKMDAFEEELMSQQQELMNDYERMVEPQLKFIKENPFNKRLKWDKVFAEGTERRNTLDFPLYLRQKRMSRYIERNEPRYRFTLGQSMPAQDTGRKKGKVAFKGILEAESEAEMELERELESDEEVVGELSEEEEPSAEEQTLEADVEANVEES